MYRFVVLLSLLLALTPGAVHANATIDRAQMLTGSAPSASDVLVGNSGGAYRYFAVAYPGGSVPVAVTMRAQPGRGTAGVGTGFKVYGPSGYFGDAIGDDRSPDDSGYALTISHLLPGTYHIQVFNYIHGLPVRFQLSAAGLPRGDAPAPAASAPPAASPDRPISIGAASLTTGGQLAGSGAGSFAYFELDYPGGATPMTITVGYAPLAYTSENAVGFNVYRLVGGDLVAVSKETGRDGTSATVGFTYVADASERFLLQVFNYLPGTTVGYTLIVTGMSGPVAEVGDISTPGLAYVLASGSSAARGAFDGDRSGRFQYFTLRYPGADREVRITITAEPNSAIGDGALGFNVFKGSEQVGTAAAGLDAKGRRVATLMVKQAEAQDFGVQVYNYSAGARAVYRIGASGF